MTQTSKEAIAVDNKFKITETSSGKIAKDAIIIVNQDKIFNQIKNVLSKKDMTWQRNDVDQFSHQMDGYDYIGTIVLDTANLKDSEKEKAFDVIRACESKGIAVILLNNHINFPLDNYNLVSVLETATIEELRGRINSNVAYSKKLCSSPELCLTSYSHDMQHQLKMAGQIQKDFLPKKMPQCPNVKWAVLYQPADWVSGDMYDVQRLDEQHLGFYIADAVGHSIPAALLTMFLSQSITFRETIDNNYRIFGPSEVMSNLNESMVKQELTGSLFATCCYCSLNIRSRQLTFARAGHPYPIVIRKNGDIEFLQARGGLLGAFENSQFEQGSVQLERGDKVFIYSDGAESLIGETKDNGQFECFDDFKSIAESGIEKMMSMFDILVRNRTFSFAERDDITALGMEIE